MQRKEIKKNYIKKIIKLKKYDKAYFDEDDPVISDKDYDDIKKEILDLERKKIKALHSQNKKENHHGPKS